MKRGRGNKLVLSDESIARLRDGKLTACALAVELGVHPKTVRSALRRSDLGYLILSMSQAAEKARSQVDPCRKKIKCREKVHRWREQGLSLANIGRRLGLSKQRVHQLLNS